MNERQFIPKNEFEIVCKQSESILDHVLSKNNIVLSPQPLGLKCKPMGLICTNHNKFDFVGGAWNKSRYTRILKHQGHTWPMDKRWMDEEWVSSTHPSIHLSDRGTYLDTCTNKFGGIFKGPTMIMGPPRSNNGPAYMMAKIWRLNLALMTIQACLLQWAPISNRPDSSFFIQKQTPPPCSGSHRLL